MNRIKLVTIFALLVSLLMVSCRDVETYAEQKSKEVAAINAYITKNKINVISEETFTAQGNKTDLEKNQYVLFESSGVYMQIVREGCGEKLESGDNADILCRFTEFNIMGDSIQLSNDNLYYASIPEKMNVKNTSGTFQGSFSAERSLMYSVYSSQSVPSGWLLPLRYIKVGRPVEDDDEIAKVNIIVPHSQGHRVASQNVTPFAYTITYQKSI